MTYLADRDVLHVVEVGQGQHPVDRALTLLAAFDPEQSIDDLPDLPVGVVDERLLRARGRYFGPYLNCFAECAACGQDLEYQLSIPELLAAGDEIDAGVKQRASQFDIDCGDYRVTLRLPTSRDLARAAVAHDLSDSRAIMIRACVMRAVRAGQPVTIDELSDSILRALGDTLDARSPTTDISIGFECPACEHRDVFALDIAAFVWDELVTLARRLIVDIHTLASTYHWSEASILAMSRQRRAWYLELISA